ncbi:MAG: hypothetical protein H8D67_14980 [Deltaproteobacteria bacterium]|nr:hypothetical protein [Deltaproteobacteria bacterium]
MVDLVRDDLINCDAFQRLAEDLGLAFSPTHEVPGLILRIRGQEKTVNILTHRSDGCILSPGQIYHPRPMERTEDFTWHNIPDNIQWWFAQNCDVYDDRLIPIPIGVENDAWARPEHKKEVILSLRKKKVKKQALVYLNANRITNFDRPYVYQLFENKEWCTIEHGKHGVDFNNYAWKVWSHKFVLCPEGNGQDTHRTWESLYLGSFPIVMRRRFTEEFAKHLPILVIDNWSEVTKDLLEEGYQKFVMKNWNWNVLKMDYWRKMVEGRLTQ